MKRFAFVTGGLALLALMAAATVPALAQTPGFNKNNFSHHLDINNKYMPLKPGTTYVYDGTSDGTPTHETFVVTRETKTILGIQARVIRDSAFEKGKLVEQTDDWFAQDNAGNVWYMGEFSTDFKNGKVVSHEGSWEAGVKGARPGIVMEAHPKVGDTYQQENAPGVAEDMAQVLSLNESICVPYGCFSNVLKTKESSPLEPAVVEHKFYAPGVGDIREVTVQGGSEEIHLVSVQAGQ